MTASVLDVPEVGTSSQQSELLTSHIGQQVAVITSSGRFCGRVVTANSELVVLREGAGRWHVETASILGVTALPARPRRRIDPQLRRRRERETLHRVMNRWP